MSTRRPWALPLVPLYRAGAALANLLRPTPRQLNWPVISIGSLSAGGAGKTPVVLAIARLLRDHGHEADILTRGYGRKGNKVERVQPALAEAADRFGDEPTLLALQAGVPVWAGKDRFAAGLAAENIEQQIPSGNDSKKSKVHLLDDGFQHRRLARTLDIVLITAEDLDDHLLPAGNLREPLAALHRADIVIVRADEAEAVTPRVWPLLREGAKLWTVRRKLHFPAPLRTFTAGLKPIAFCALARPDDFAASLLAAGCGIAETVAYPDHHRYTPADIDHIAAIAKKLNATGFVTSEKDAVKLTPPLRERLEVHGPLMVVALEAVFDDPDAILRTLEAALLEASGVRP